jgi:hypothetical protein
MKTRTVRTFKTGATRNGEEGKHDPEGFLSPLVVQRFNEYMHKHRVQVDGRLRASDNWQRGIPRAVYMKSAWRHFLAWWTWHRNEDRESQRAAEESICALLFNTMGYLHELLLRRP